MREDTMTKVRHGRNEHHNTAVVVRCFGAFEVYLAGEPVLSWHAGKARNLFQYLLLNRGRIVRRETLFAALWPGSSWSSAAKSLKVAVHAVRRTFGQVAQPGPGNRPDPPT